MTTPDFIWGTMDATSFMKSLDLAYDTVVHWRRNFFKVPQGNSGKHFVVELARLFDAFAAGSALESVALKAATVMPQLLLQKSHRRSKTKEHIECLKRRLNSWKDGDIQSLLNEGLAVQKRLPKGTPRKVSDNVARTFANLMFSGKTHAALQLLSKNGRGGILHLDESVDNNGSLQSVKDILKSKHPSSQPSTPDSKISGVPPEVHSVIFDPIDSSLIRSTALRVHGAAGPSGLDAYDWRRLCTSFQSASTTLCQALALSAKRLCTVNINPTALSPLLACRLIALDKCPGVRPIGIGNTARRILAKAILHTIKGDVQDAAGSRQLCAGQMAGVEAAVHAVRECFLQDATEAALLVDATNAFNSLNTALHNIQFTCPALATVLQNTYRAPSDLFIDGEAILSQEGTTQGDPLAMPMYAMATLPLIERLPQSATQVWYADDASALGSLSDLRARWDDLARRGPTFGYFPNASKTWLVTKSELHQEALRTFENSSVNITCVGRPHLGAPLGSTSYVDQFVLDKVNLWSDELKQLSDFAVTQPHAAFAAFTHGMVSRWSYITRTVPNISHHLQTLEDTIRMKLIPTLTGRPPPVDQDRDLFGLPARLGGLGLRNPVRSADDEFCASKKITRPLKDHILLQQHDYSYEVFTEQMLAKAEVRKQNRDRIDERANLLQQAAAPSLQRIIDLAQEKGASSWLTTLPIAEFGFNLHKGAFVDALALRYGWPPPRTPATCACGARFSVEHALSCPKGALPIIRHNEIRDLTASLLTEVCHDVRTEPDLQPLSNEIMSAATSNTSTGARLDVAANGFWGSRFERAYLDVRVFNPFAPSNQQSSISACYRSHENMKKRSYEQRIREVEHATFTPLVLSATGGMARQATTFYKRLASLLAAKHDQPYGPTVNWLRCRLSFSLLRSAIQCIRGARSSCGHAVSTPPIDLAIAETQLQH